MVVVNVPSHRKVQNLNKILSTNRSPLMASRSGSLAYDGPQWAIIFVSFCSFVIFAAIIDVFSSESQALTKISN